MYVTWKRVRPLQTRRWFFNVEEFAICTHGESVFGFLLQVKYVLFTAVRFVWSLRPLCVLAFRESHGKRWGHANVLAGSSVWSSTKHECVRFTSERYPKRIFLLSTSVHLAAWPDLTSVGQRPVYIAALYIWSYCCTSILIWYMRMFSVDRPDTLRMWRPWSSRWGPLDTYMYKPVEEKQWSSQVGSP